MVSSLIICGSHGMKEKEEEDDYLDERAIRSAGSSPRKHSSRCGSRSHSKNPYSARGLDKFSALLAEIEEKRRMIYSEISPDQISLVRFDFSENNDGKPIVVKAKADQIQNKRKNKTSSVQPDPIEKIRGEREMRPEIQIPARGLNLRRLRRPQYYLPAVVIVILVLLLMFGRSAAIMFTSIGWYLIPTISEGNCKRLTKKKTIVGHQGGGSSFKVVNHGGR